MKKSDYNYNFLNISAEELLSYCITRGIVNMDDVQDQMTKKFKKTILKHHNHKIWQGSDQRYRTHVSDNTKKSGRRLVVKTYEEDLLKYLGEFYGISESKENAISLEDLYPDWKSYKEIHTTAKNYIRRIHNDWEKYYAGTDIIKKPLNQLKTLDLDTWAHKLIKDNSMTKKQYYNATIIMRQSLDYAVVLGIITENPFSAVHIDGKRMFRRVKKKADATQVYLKNEVEPIYKMAWEDFYSPNKLKNKLTPLAILFQFQTGVRIGELCVVSYSDIEDNQHLHIQRMYRYETHEVIEHTKNFEDRTVLLTSSARQIIETARAYQKEHGCRTDGYIFSEDNTPLAPWSVAYLYNKYCDHLGIMRKSSHKTRKTYISALIDGKVNINTIREMVGHADERTTYNNYCFDRSTEDEKVNLIEKALVS